MVNHPLEDRLEKLRFEHYNGSYEPSFEYFINIIEIYSKFLLDGDFDYWQPCCYPECDPAEYNSKYNEAQELKVDYSSKIPVKIQQYRILWIKNRFPSWCSKEWVDRDYELMDLWKIIPAEDFSVVWWNNV